MTRTVIVVLRGTNVWWSQLSEGERVEMMFDTLMFVGKDGRAVKFGCESAPVKGPSVLGQVLDLGLLFSQPAGADTTIVGEGLKRKYEDKATSMDAERQRRLSSLDASRNDMTELARLMQETITCEAKLTDVLGDGRLPGPARLPLAMPSGLVDGVGATARTSTVQPPAADQHRHSQQLPSGSGPDPTSHRPLGKQRKVGLLILVFIISITIYVYYWTYKTYEDLKQYNGTGFGGIGGVLIWFVCPFITLFELPLEIKNMYEDDGQISPVGVSTALWGFLLIPWWVKCQRAMNAFWASKGAPSATGV